MRTVKIISCHSSVAEAVKAANFTRPGYETALADNIRLADNPPAHWRSGPDAIKPCTRAFVVEAFSNSARIYGDKFEVVYVTECDIAILHRLQIGGCLSDLGFELAAVRDGVIEIGAEFSVGGRVVIPEGKRISKSPDGRAWLACMHAIEPSFFASNLDYTG